VFSSFIVWYLFMAGVGSGAFVVAAFSFVGRARRILSASNTAVSVDSVNTHAEQVRETTGLVVATLCMAVAALSLLFDFAEPLKTWRVILTPFSSLASFGANVIWVFILLALLLTLVVLFRLHLPHWLFWLSLGLGTVLAFAVMLYAGFLLAGMVSVDVWHTWLVPLLFVLSSLACGLAAVLFLETLFLGVRQQGFALRWRLLCALGLLELAVLAVFLAERSVFSSTARDSVFMLLAGEQAVFFLGGVVAVGLTVPLLTHLLFRWLPLESLTLVATACVLAGGFFLRYCLVGVAHFTPIFPMT
jgi:formate-dependent nitrite reductase membrane component NrfD